MSDLDTTADHRFLFAWLRHRAGRPLCPGSGASWFSGLAHMKLSRRSMDSRAHKLDREAWSTPPCHAHTHCTRRGVTRSETEQSLWTKRYKNLKNCFINPNYDHTSAHRKQFSPGVTVHSKLLFREELQRPVAWWDTTTTFCHWHAAAILQQLSFWTPTTWGDKNQKKRRKSKETQRNNEFHVMNV